MASQQDRSESQLGAHPGAHPGATGEPNRPAQPARCGTQFEIRVKGHLNSTWSDWLEGLEVKLLDNGETVLSGTIVDQAALMGILNRLYRLNVTLLSVCEVSHKS